MSDTNKPGPVDNSSLDAGIAAREVKQEAKTEEVAEQAAEIVEDDLDDAQNESDTEDSAAPDDDEGDDAKAKADKPKRKGVGKRIDELTREKYDAIRERDHWREQAIKAQQPPESQPAQAPERSDEPTLESCDFDITEFNREHYKWMREQERAEESRTKAQETAAEKAIEFKGRETAFAAEHPDYYDVAYTAPVDYSEAMLEAMRESDDSPAIAYYLATHLEEAAKISLMSPFVAARAIGRIEASLSAPQASAQPRQPEPKTVTKAPAPVTKLSGSPAQTKNYDDMSMREYDAQRRKERAAKGLSP